MCEICGKEIRAMAFKGTGVDSEICRKIRAGEISKPYINVDPKGTIHALDT